MSIINLPGTRMCSYGGDRRLIRNKRIDNKNRKYVERYREGFY